MVNQTVFLRIALMYYQISTTDGMTTTVGLMVITSVSMVSNYKRCNTQGWWRWVQSGREGEEMGAEWHVGVIRESKLKHSDTGSSVHLLSQISLF